QLFTDGRGEALRGEQRDRLEAARCEQRRDFLRPSAIPCIETARVVVQEGSVLREARHELAVTKVRPLLPRGHRPLEEPEPWHERGEQETARSKHARNFAGSALAAFSFRQVVKRPQAQRGI